MKQVLMKQVLMKQVLLSMHQLLLKQLLMKQLLLSMDLHPKRTTDHLIEDPALLARFRYLWSCWRWAVEHLAAGGALTLLPGQGTRCRGRRHKHLQEAAGHRASFDSNFAELVLARQDEEEEDDLAEEAPLPMAVLLPQLHPMQRSPVLVDLAVVVVDLAYGLDPHATNDRQ